MGQRPNPFRAIAAVWLEGMQMLVRAAFGKNK